MASQVLSISTKRIVKDWAWYYAKIPIIVETFVQVSKFKGTCYKAANWKHVGMTRGYSKKGNIYYANNEPKFIFVYGLNKQVRHVINTHLNKETTLKCRA